MAGAWSDGGKVSVTFKRSSQVEHAEGRLPGLLGASGSGGDGRGAMGTTAAYAWLSTRLAAAGARPASDSLRSSSMGLFPADVRMHSRAIASALQLASPVHRARSLLECIYYSSYMFVTTATERTTQGTFSFQQCPK